MRVIDKEQIGDIKEAAGKLRGAFDWSDTSEGHLYWADVCRKLTDKALHGNLDGKKPEPTFEKDEVVVVGEELKRHYSHFEGGKHYVFDDGRSILTITYPTAISSWPSIRKLEKSE